jgi:hypothetical protein
MQLYLEGPCIGTQLGSSSYMTLYVQQTAVNNISLQQTSQQLLSVKAIYCNCDSMLPFRLMAKMSKFKTPLYCATVNDKIKKNCAMFVPSWLLIKMIKKELTSNWAKEDKADKLELQ